MRPQKKFEKMAPPVSQISYFNFEGGRGAVIDLARLSAPSYGARSTMVGVPASASDCTTYELYMRSPRQPMAIAQADTQTGGYCHRPQRHTGGKTTYARAAARPRSKDELHTGPPGRPRAPNAIRLAEPSDTGWQTPSTLDTHRHEAPAGRATNSKTLSRRLAVP